MARSFADIIAGFDPHHRLEQRRMLMQEQMEGARLQLQQQQHNEMMTLQQERIHQQEQHHRERIEATRESEIIAGENAQTLSRQNFLQNELNENTKLIHSLFTGLSERRRDWNNRVSETKRALYEVEADTLRQKSLEKQRHEQEMEKMRLAHELQIQQNSQIHNQNTAFEINKTQLQASIEKQQQKQKLEAMVLDYNLRVLEKNLDSLLQDKRVTYDGLNEILMRVISRFLGLGETQLNDWEMEQYIKEAMKQI